MELALEMQWIALVLSQKVSVADSLAVLEVCPPLVGACGGRRLVFGGDLLILPLLFA